MISDGISDELWCLLSADCKCIASSCAIESVGFGPVLSSSTVSADAGTKETTDIKASAETNIIVTGIMQRTVLLTMLLCPFFLM